MAPSAAQLVYRHLRKLTTPHGDPQPDHQLLQRFLTTREESAFAALVQRHGPMVLGVCRSILHNTHDAEDIFQAVFLVLARKAGSIRRGASVGSWLYAVAYRLAHKARVRADKRRIIEQQAPARPGQTPMDDVTWGELRGVLHEEVSRLPEKLRAAVVLCYWEGRTHEQAGQQLGCAKGTIKDRLERARELLRSRLARRGLALPAAWFAASLSGATSSAALPAELVQTTVRGARLFTMGQLPAEVVSAHTVACAKDALQGMFLGKLKMVLACALMASVLGGGAGWLALQGPPPQPKPTSETQPPPPSEARQAVDRQGDPLPPGALGRLGTLRFRHDESVGGMQIGPDKKSIITFAGKIVHVWELPTGKERCRFEHENNVTSLACSRDGKLLASGCQDGTIHLWDTATRREIRQFQAHKGRAPKWIGPNGVFCLAFTPDGQQLVSLGSEGAIRLWHAATGELIRTFDEQQAWYLALSPDGQTLAGVVGEESNRRLRLWDVATGREGKGPAPKGRVWQAFFSPDGKILAVLVGDSDANKPFGDIQLWDMAGRKEIRTLRMPKAWSFAFSPDGKTLALAAQNYADRTTEIHQWEASTGQESRRIRIAPWVWFNDFHFCPDGQTLVSRHQNEQTLRFWDLASGKEVRSSRDAVSCIESISFAPDGRCLAAGSEDGVLRLWDVRTQKEVRHFQRDFYLISVLFSPDGRQLASAGLGDPQVGIWDAADSKLRRRIKGAKEGDSMVRSLAWSSDGKVLAGWDRADRCIHLWEAATGAGLRQLNCGETAINALAFSPHSPVLAAVGGSYGRKNSLLLWATDTGRLLWSREPPFSLHCVAFAPDGRMLAVGGKRTVLAGDNMEEREVSLWEVVSGRCRLTLKHSGNATTLAFSPDGNLLASASDKASRLRTGDGLVACEDPGKPERPRVRLWDLAAEKELPPLEGHKGAITSLAFSPDGKLLASASNDTTVLLWDATRLRKAARHAEAPLRPAQLEALWDDIGGEDAVKAYQAIRALAAAPQASVEFFKCRLHPVRPADSKQVAHLLADLDGDDFTAREKATRELEKLGDAAATDLRKALAGRPSLEVKRRIEQLLEAHNGREHIRMMRALEALEKMGTPEARALCERLAGGAAEAQLTREARATLRRLSR